MTKSMDLAQRLKRCRTEKGRLRIVTDLRWADLSGADLSGADLSGAALSGADLSGADLSGADLSGADLRWADLSGADLRWVDLSGANLESVALRICGLWEVRISDQKISIGCKDKPSFDAWDEWFAGVEELTHRRGTVGFDEIRLNYEYAKLFYRKWILSGFAKMEDRP